MAKVPLSSFLPPRARKALRGHGSDEHKDCWQLRKVFMQHKHYEDIMQDSRHWEKCFASFAQK
jgi:hypothetical protein